MRPGSGNSRRAHRQLSNFILHRQRRNEKMKFLKDLASAILIAVCITVLVWLVVSWTDVLMYNDPIYGDKQYMPGNAIVLMTELAK